MIVDAHRHYWDPSQLDYAWLADAPMPLRRSFLPGDLAPNTDGCILVQAAPDERETRFLFGLARRTAGALGVVGWVDMQASDVGARLRRLIVDGDGLLCGIRPMVQDIPDPTWLASPTLDPAFDLLRDHDLVFEALVDGRHLRALAKRLARHPGLRTVVDHAAKPDMTGHGFAEWSGAIARLAQLPDVHCKFSGLITLTGSVADTYAMEPYVAHLFETFGASRLIWGSDWPVVTTHATYEGWKTIARDLVRQHAPDAEAQIFGGNARSLYSLASRISA